MAQKIRKPAPLKTKHFIASRDAQDAAQTLRTTWKIRRRPSRKSQSDDVEADKVIGTVRRAEPDSYECAELTIAFDEDLSVDAYGEILTPILGAASEDAHVTFLKLRQDGIAEGGPLRAAVEKLQFVPDPANPGYLVWEKALTNWPSIYMCLGISVGMSLGMSLGKSGTGMTLGMSLGLTCGLCIGSALSASEKKKRDALRQARTAHAAPPKEE